MPVGVACNLLLKNLAKTLDELELIERFFI